MSGAYVAEVERAFLSEVGRGLMLCAQDLELVLRWERAGVPVHVVVGGIERAFEGRPAGRVRRLSFACRTVEGAIRAWRSRQVGAHRDPGEREPSRREALGALIDDLRGATEVATQRADAALISAASARAQGRLAALAEGQAGDDLDAIEADLLDLIWREGLGPGVAREVAEAARSIAGCDDEEVVVAQRRRLVRERLGLPALVLRLGPR